MRALAGQLGVQAMSLYHHVANREEILDRIVDAVYGRFYAPVPGRPWREELRRRSVEAARVLGDHAWVIPLMNSRRTPGLATITHLDAVIACLDEAGFTTELTAHAFALIDAHLYGFMTQAASLPFEGEEGIREMAAELEQSNIMAEAPHFAAFAQAQALQPGYDFMDEFTWGLDAVLDAVE
ncbi:MAG TPA: TetR/AcrR family transcriptional regulator, partial [Actinomycetales bacterium]|nr:TetR/AcrR family transcriptional regulator [Actinomycetales bacterium]